MGIINKKQIKKCSRLSPSSPSLSRPAPSGFPAPTPLLLPVLLLLLLSLLPVLLLLLLSARLLLPKWPSLSSKDKLKLEFSRLGPQNPPLRRLNSWPTRSSPWPTETTVASSNSLRSPHLIWASSSLPMLTAISSSPEMRLLLLLLPLSCISMTRRLWLLWQQKKPTRLLLLLLLPLLPLLSPLPQPPPEPFA